MWDACINTWLTILLVQIWIYINLWLSREVIDAKEIFAWQKYCQSHIYVLIILLSWKSTQTSLDCNLKCSKNEQSVNWSCQKEKKSSCWKAKGDKSFRPSLWIAWWLKLLIFIERWWGTHKRQSMLNLFHLLSQCTQAFWTWCLWKFDWKETDV